jgi:hypothetical protein
VAAWVELQESSSAAAAAPRTPPASAPAAPESETTSWWAGLVTPDGAATPVTRTSIWPTAAAGPQPLDVASTPVPPVPAPDTDPDGLARRVPGTHLIPALRRDAAAGPPPEADGGRDAERVRAMLSRFQASQNAGRVAADGPPPGPPEENP